MFKVNLKYFVLIICIAAFSCKDNSVTTNNSENETLLFRLDGVIENLGGDCSAVQVRTRSLGNFDLTNVNNVKFNFTGMSDADLSSVSIFYIDHNNELVNLINLTDRDQINTTSVAQVNSPRINTELFLRVTLKSSVCTGQIFYLTFRDLKIYAVR